MLALRPVWVMIILTTVAGLTAQGRRPCDAADLVVDNVSGSDSQNDRGLVPGPPTFGPYRTIGRALAAAQPGDRIVLTPTDEPYRECVSLTGTRHSGGPVAPFQIIGNGAVLDGSEFARPTAWELVGEGIYQYQQTPPGFGLMLLEGDRLQRVSKQDTEQASFRLKPMQWTRLGGRFLFRPEPNRSATEYDIEMTMQTTGISLYDVQNVEIRDLTVRGYRIDGINAHDRATGVRLINVTCLENGRSGVSVGGACHVRLESSRLYGNGVAQVRTEGRSELTVSDVEVDSTSAPELIRDGGRVVGDL
ncbi:MAG: right-handed parallel beta-helix repeat-containing protein [Pirellulaceae bacterium]